jgi:hypothetical protein
MIWWCRCSTHGERREGKAALVGWDVAHLGWLLCVCVFVCLCVCVFVCLCVCVLQREYVDTLLLPVE